MKFDGEAWLAFLRLILPNLFKILTKRRERTHWYFNCEVEFLVTGLRNSILLKHYKRKTNSPSWPLLTSPHLCSCPAVWGGGDLTVFPWPETATRSCKRCPKNSMSTVSMSQESPTKEHPWGRHWREAPDVYLSQRIMLVTAPQSHFDGRFSNSCRGLCTFWILSSTL